MSERLISEQLSDTIRDYQSKCGALAREFNERLTASMSYALGVTFCDTLAQYWEKPLEVVGLHDTDIGPWVGQKLEEDIGVRPQDPEPDGYTGPALQKSFDEWTAKRRERLFRVVSEKETDDVTDLEGDNLEASLKKHVADLAQELGKRMMKLEEGGYNVTRVTLIEAPKAYVHCQAFMLEWFTYTLVYLHIQTKEG